MSIATRAIVFPGINQVEIRNVTVPPPGETEILVKTLYSMVSTGTELRVLAGEYGAKDAFPLVPGYSSVGRVIEVGAKASGYRVGDLVSGRNPRTVPGTSCYWGGQCGHHVFFTTTEDRPIVLPEGCDPKDYLIAEIGGISFRGAEAAEPAPAETVIVIGQGLIGALSAVWFNIMGARVIACDVEDFRLELARKRGISATVNTRQKDAADRLKALAPHGADIVVEASGVAAGVQLAYSLVRRRPVTPYRTEIRPNGRWPRLLMQANYLSDVSINPHGFFAGEGVTILTPMDRSVDDRIAVIEHIRRGNLKSSDFVDSIRSIEEAPKSYKELQTEPGKVFSIAFQWPG